MHTSEDKVLRDQLIKHLEGGEAFIPLDHLLDKIAFDDLGKIPEGLPYSFYQQFYHIWLAQNDILEFTRHSNYQPLEWPKDYWPEAKAPKDEKEWQNLVQRYFEDRQQLCGYISDSRNELFVPFTHGEEQTLFREAMLVVEHTAYHTGQLLVILRLLGLH
ncbi:DinB family protein [Porifericola rhodea]|uniref:DinB family protein n=1 Tax=Porifericola rhodea TaxID=930972 RepID=UPI002666BD21|nr:DinB family protein [Porifericola rhodea]WKN29596.1 DinB family protein [Porifericola rhodea]